MELPNSSGFEYGYDAVNLKEIHRLKNGERIYSHYDLTHNTSGLTTSARLPGENGVIHFGYDQLSRLTEITQNSLKQKVSDNGYDAAGNLLRYVSQDEEQLFTYDDLNQLTSEKGSLDHTYQSDSLANRLLKDG